MKTGGELLKLVEKCRALDREFDRIDQYLGGVQKERESARTTLLKELKSRKTIPVVNGKAIFWDSWDGKLECRPVEILETSQKTCETRCVNSINPDLNPGDLAGIEPGDGLELVITDGGAS